MIRISNSYRTELQFATSIVHHIPKDLEVTCTLGSQNVMLLQFDDLQTSPLRIRRGSLFASMLSYLNDGFLLRNNIMTAATWQALISLLRHQYVASDGDKYYLTDRGQEQVDKVTRSIKVPNFVIKNIFDGLLIYSLNSVSCIQTRELTLDRVRHYILTTSTYLKSRGAYLYAKTLQRMGYINSIGL